MSRQLHKFGLKVYGSMIDKLLSTITAIAIMDIVCYMLWTM